VTGEKNVKAKTKMQLDQLLLYAHLFSFSNYLMMFKKKFGSHSKPVAFTPPAVFSLLAVLVCHCDNF